LLNLKEIGYFTKTHGLKGHLNLFLRTSVHVDLVKSVFIEIDESKIPFKLAEKKVFKNGLIVLLDGLDNIDKVGTFPGKKVFIDSKYVHKNERNELEGYLLIDEQFGDVGVVLEITDSEVNPLILVDYKGKQVMLPYYSDFIIKIEKEAKILRYKAPEGLIEMYV